MIAMKNLPKSTRKYIRTEKAQIHREIFDIKEQEKLIDELYKKVKRDTNTRIPHE
jgi:hypothetical protein